MPTPDKPAKGAARDALDLLKADHDKVKHLFRAFGSLKGIDDEDQRKAELVDEICNELTVHTMIEEEIFYPFLRATIDDDELMDDAEAEHAGARDLIRQLEVMYPGDDLFDATVAVLSDEIGQHIEQEESALFAAARKAGVDLGALGQRLSARKEQLDEDLSSPPGTQGGMQPHEGARRPLRPPD